MGFKWMYTGQGRRWSVSLFLLLTGCLTFNVQAGVVFPGRPPGRAEISVHGAETTLKSGAFTMKVSRNNSGNWLLDLKSTYSPNGFEGVNEAQLELGNGQVVRLSDFKLLDGFEKSSVMVNKRGYSIHERVPGFQVSAKLKWQDLVLDWRAEIRHNDSYVRQFFTFSSEKEVQVKSLKLLNAPLPNVTKVGVVQGSPLSFGCFWAGLEHPMAFMEATDGKGVCEYRGFTVKADSPKTFVLAIGATPKNQLRRAFSYYLERVRPRPYKPLVHYNSWYDIAHSNRGPFSEKETLEAVEFFVNELTRKRGVKMDSILLDDGWDDYEKSLWEFHDGWPNELEAVGQLCKKYGLGPGIWLSPWGGYGYRKNARVKTANQMGVGALQLGRPGYYKIFSEFCLRMMKKYGCNHFKFDGIGAGNSGMGAFNTAADFDAAMKLFEDMRAINPDVYINLTTGTWPSPFWMLSADSIWRSGTDHSFAGVGPDRQKWITYRDQVTYEKVVKNAPLFPLNSIMNHGVVFAKHAHHLTSTNDKDFRDEVRAFVACGTQMQEYYITPGLLNQQNWDDLAEGISWLRKNSAILADTHWIGGDPKNLEVYGWGAWTPDKSIITLRNPSDKAQTFSGNIGELLESPRGAKVKYRLKHGFKDQQQPLPKITSQLQVNLAPFEVLVLECLPVK